MTTRLGRTLRTIRNDRGLTIAEVARVTGIHHSQLSRIESGRRVGLLTLRQYVARMDLSDTEVVRIGVAAIQPHERTGNTLRRTTE